MKLPAFEYACPATLKEAVALLASHDGEAKPIAGGQSLMPMMAFRVAQPSLLVDLRKLPDLNKIAIDKDGVRLGAMVRWRDILDDKILSEDYFMYGEDLELCWHVRKQAKKRLYYLSTAHVLHLGNASGKQADGMYVESSYSVYKYLLRTRGLGVALVERVLRFLSSALQLPVALLRRYMSDSPRTRRTLHNHAKTVLWTLGLYSSAGKPRS